MLQLAFYYQTKKCSRNTVDALKFKLYCCVFQQEAKKTRNFFIYIFKKIISSVSF